MYRDVRFGPDLKLEGTRTIHRNTLLIGRIEMSLEETRLPSLLIRPVGRHTIVTCGSWRHTSIRVKTTSQLDSRLEGGW